MRLEGQIVSAGPVKIEGVVVGNVDSETQVLVATRGTVKGDIRAPEIVVNGAVSGAIPAGDSAALGLSSVITGDITSKLLVVQEGGKINGRLRIKKKQSTLEASTVEHPTHFLDHQGLSRATSRSRRSERNQRNRRVS